MTVVSSVLTFVAENKEVVALIVGVIALSYPKLPHPDKFLGTNWYFPYLVLHGILARVSVLEWNKQGGAVKLPGTLQPSLEAARNSETLGNLSKSLRQVQAEPETYRHAARVSPRASVGEFSATTYMSQEESQKIYKDSQLEGK
jgi:hypothetical protein